MLIARKMASPVQEVQHTITELIKLICLVEFTSERPILNLNSDFASLRRV